MSTEAQRLHLRPVMASDLVDLFRIYGDPATNTFNPSGPYPDIHHATTVLNRWLEHWEKNGFGNWAISLHEHPEIIIGFGGLSVLRYSDIAINNLGYRFATEVWGKGLATEFSAYTVRYGFEDLELPEISAVVRANHQASRNVLEKTGLIYLRDIDDVKGAPPSLLYSLTREEWRERQSE